MRIFSTIIYLYHNNFSTKIEAKKDTLEMEMVLHYLRLNLKISFVLLNEMFKIFTKVTSVVN